MSFKLFQLAKELGVESKAIIAKCHAEGILTINKHTDAVKAGLALCIREWFAAGELKTAVITDTYKANIPLKPPLKVFQLAKELGVESTAIITKCRAEGVPDINKHTDAVKAGLAFTIREWFAAGELKTAAISDTYNANIPLKPLPPVAMPHGISNVPTESIAVTPKAKLFKPLPARIRGPILVSKASTLPKAALDSTLKSKTSEEKMIGVGSNFLIDGTNVCGWALAGKSRNKQLNLRILITLLISLEQTRNHSYLCIFDANTRHNLADASDVEALNELLTYQDYFSEVTGGKRADDFLLLEGSRSKSPIITNDRFKDYREREPRKYAWLEGEERLIKGGVIGKKLSIPDLDISEPIEKDIVGLMASLRKYLKSV